MPHRGGEPAAVRRDSNDMNHGTSARPHAHRGQDRWRRLRRLAGALAVGVALATSGNAARAQMASTSDTGANDLDAVEANLVEAVERTRAASQVEIQQAVEIGIPYVGTIDLDVSASVASVDPPVVHTIARTSQLPGATVELITDGGEAWVRYTGDGEPFVPGLEPGTWVRGEFDELVELGFLEPIDDSFAFLDLLFGVTSIANAGEDEINGAPATRLDIAVDFDAAVERAPAPRGEALGERIVLTGAGGPLILEGSVWIDETQHIVKLDLSGTAPVEDENVDDEFTVDLVLELSEIDGDVEVPEPPTTDVVTLDDLLG